MSALVAIFAILAAAPDPNAAALPAGVLRPTLPPSPEEKEIAIAPFRLDRAPVTNADFLRFATTHRTWARDRAGAPWVDPRYLSRWRGPLELGPAALADAPVVEVSWFAASAYCQARGGRLPTWAEWEYAAAASETEADGRGDPAWRRAILSWYARPSPKTLAAVRGGRPNFYGLWDLHGAIWEWVLDFNGVLVGSDTREAGSDDQRFCGAGAIGAADSNDYAVFMRVAFLSSLEARFTVGNLGFRCAYDAGGALEDGPSARTPSAQGGGSLYQAELSLEDDAGARIPLDQHRGRPVVVTMFYGTCGSTCPMVFERLKRLDQKLDPTAREQTRYLLLSFDPVRDTPQQLALLLRRHRLERRRFTLARAPAGDIRTLANLLGIKYRRSADGRVDHSSVVALLGPSGEVVTRVEGRAADLAPIAEKIAALEARAPSR